MTLATARPTAQSMSIDTSPAFTHRCAESAVFECDLATAYGALFRMAEWPQRLPHVDVIDVSYDDGQYQEFWMTVQSDTDGAPLKVRSVRNCTEGTIEFFQPVPPVFLTNHGGIWRFRPIDETHTEVTVTHVWNLKPEVAAETFPPKERATTEDQVSDLLAGHSRLTLSGWQRALAPASTSATKEA